MKKTILSFAIIIGLINLSTAKSVDVSTAETVAKNHICYVTNLNTNIDLELVYESITITMSNSRSPETPLFYVFNIADDKGFVIVAGDDNVLPILGYTTSGSYDNTNLPPNFKKWLENYKVGIRYVIENAIEATDEIDAKWERLIYGPDDLTRKPNFTVSPLMTTEWSQSPYYNDQCPYDNLNGGRSVTGCVATAMAQIMNFWEYPAQGTGFHSYNHSNFGTLSANFGGTTYQWSSMPNSVNSSNNAVATLMYHCGVSVDMNYSSESSGAYVISSQSPVTHCSEYAFTTYFGYQNTVDGIERSSYSTSQWIQLLKTELDAGRPILYAGFGSGGGHAFVCDGFDINDYFHMNWGWGGYYDGYFSIDALDPSGTGTGGGSGGYNSGHQAIIGINPPSSSTTYELALYDDVTAPGSIYYGQGFTVHTDIINNGTNSFSGDYCAAVFDEDYNFIDFVEIKTESTGLPAGYHYTNGLDFTNTGLFTILPGTYNIIIFYKPIAGNWLQIDGGSYSNLAQLDVVYSNDIELYEAINVNIGTSIKQNEAFEVTLDVANYGSTDFSGIFDVSLYDLEGNFEETVETKTGMNLGAGNHYLNGLTFTSTGVSIEPGTYLMALSHKEDSGDWELSGSTYYTNPIKVTILEASIAPDNYESNDTKSEAYNLPINFNGSNATVLTTGSNSHVGTDYDYYKIVLPAGYDYSITARAHDSYESGNGNTYTNDILWSYTTTTTWSDAYDDIMPGTIALDGGGTVYFHISPYFEGQTGTYLFDIQISRTATIGINEQFLSEEFNIFPNPAKDFINIEITNNEKIQNVKIIDLTGKQILYFNNTGTHNEHLKIPIENLSNGNYMLIIDTREKIWYKKFTKLE